jgi:hypothetical protein
MLPFIQCHQTRGLAEFGGFLKPSSIEAGAFCATDEGARAPTKVNSAIPRTLIMREEWLTGAPQFLATVQIGHDEFALSDLSQHRRAGFAVYVAALAQVRGVSRSTLCDSCS